ncbi:MAG: 5'-methylthioadenosine/adenosylhomocysteine nucleosidase, partial [Fusobacterium sp. JB020]|nr:5'-methylthioadenosine/adenosylhomocysteine nucleosidase [Fusobacterium sp. JB020]
MKKIFFSVVAFFMFSVITFSKIAVMGAMDEEIDLLKKGMKDVKETKIGRIVYYEGNLDGKEIVLFKSGVGKVNATIGADVAIREFKVDKIIFTGIAGA